MGLIPHTGKTLMLAELQLLCDACPPDIDPDELRRQVIDENVLRKSTASNRRETLRRLRQLYGLKPDTALYRAFRALSAAFPCDQPMLALLLASARDRTLRVTAPFVLALPEGDSVMPDDLLNVLEAEYPNRYSPGVLRSLSQNLASSWRQSGHLAGKLRKTRQRASAGPGSTAYALWMGHLCGVRGRPLFETLWARLLDAPANVLEAHAFSASQRGWLEYRASGEVVEVGFRRLAEITGANPE